MTFGERLVKSRKEAGYSQKELAEKLGITPTRLNYWEKDKRQPDVELIKALSSCLGVSSDYLIDNEGSKNSAPKNRDGGLSYEAKTIAEKYEQLDEIGKKCVKAVIDTELERVETPVIPTKTIPLFGAAFAAGIGEPDFGNPWENYEVPEDSRAEFAVRISGNSMEPYLPDGSIAFGRKATPRDGDVGAFLLDGAFLVKQVCVDCYNNVYLFSLNRARADADVTIWSNSDRSLSCFGTIIMEKRISLPRE